MKTILRIALALENIVTALRVIEARMRTSNTHLYEIRRLMEVNNAMHEDFNQHVLADDDDD